MRQGDIILTNFPFTSLDQFKVRPAMIISNEKFNNGVDVILIGIFGVNNEYSMPIDKTDLLEGILNKQSYLRFSNVFSSDKQLLMRKIGSFKKESVKKIIKNFNKYFETS